MSTHDIIDNRSEKLTEHINSILKNTEKCKFAVGYFFLSGFEAVQKYLKGGKKVRRKNLFVGDFDVCAFCLRQAAAITP